MTDRLKKAVEQAAARLTNANQDLLAEALTRLAQDERAFPFLLVALDEALWNYTFAKSQDKLKKLADRARRAYDAGETEPLDLDKF